MKEVALNSKSVELLYPNDNATIQTYMRLTIQALEQQFNGNIPDHYIIQLDLLRDMWRTYLKTQQELATQPIFKTAKDTGRTYMNPGVQLQQQTYTKLMDMYKSLGITLFESKKSKIMDKKIDDVTEDESAQELSEKLLA